MACGSGMSLSATWRASMNATPVVPSLLGRITPLWLVPSRSSEATITWRRSSSGMLASTAA